MGVYIFTRDRYINWFGEQVVEINGERNGMYRGRSPKTRESERKEKPQLFKSLRDLIGGGKGSQLQYRFILVLCRRSSGSPNFQLYTYCDMLLL